MDDDRRAALEAAFDAHDTAEETPPVEGEVIAEATEVATETPAVEGESTETPTVEAEATEKPAVETHPVQTENEKIPQSWKAAAKSKWGTVDPEVRQEIWRREREVTTALNESATARNIVKQIAEIAAPFAPRLQAQGVNPVTAFQKMLRADYVLATGSKQQRAEHLAQLIKDYDIDIGVLDQVLAGKTSPAALEEDRIARLLDQRLAPVTQKLQTYEQREQQEQQEQERTFAANIEAMAADQKTYPHFEQVRDAMADLVEISVRRGVSLDLKTAYNRAVAADPDLSTALESARQADLLKQAAKRAQQAKQASASVSGSPTGSLAKGSVATDRRATIAAAFEALGS